MIINPLLKDPASPLQASYANSVIQLIFSIFLFVGVIYFVWHLVFAAYHFIASEGDAKKVEDAKREITYALVGVFVLFSVFAVLKVIGIIFAIPGLDRLNLSLPSL